MPRLGPISAVAVLRTLSPAPDPGLHRLRTAARAVLGVGLSVAAAVAAGLPLPAAVTGGLAALLALFTVTDPSVRRQAATTALLPAAGLPVLALATVLREDPVLRDGAFLLVVLGGVYARRWGPRGHALGIFAFMMFFAVQFLDAVPGRLPELSAAVLLSVAVSGAVRFAAWPIERRTPPPELPAPQGGRGLGRPTTRQAVQATAACALALGAGQALSQERWYWAVGTVWWIFVNTASRGETLVRGWRRVVGTVTGVAAGLFTAVPLHGQPAPSAVLVAVCVFGIFYTAPLSYSWMMFFVTVMAGLLYGLLGVLDEALLALRVAETLAGAVAVALAVAVVLPVTTHASTDAWIQRSLMCVRQCTAEASRRLAGDGNADPAPHADALGPLLDRVRVSVAPLLHPLNPFTARRERARRIVALLDECAGHLRDLTELAADPAASHDTRLTDACRRVEAAVAALVTPGAAVAAARPAPVEAPRHPGAERALACLHGLEEALASLAAPLRCSPRAPLASS
ncbi:FUSC family protein [Streptomyces sp. F63]|uniref:FUSC family protein n=1 Tax=Streptomyces sp. F63 TaxID=2824887 RepID=UPI0027DD5C4B|nr:FUSC family protein [Streptomyces sp. F63]